MNKRLQDQLNQLQQRKFVMFSILYVFAVNYLHLYSHHNIGYLASLLSLANLFLVYLWIDREGMERFKAVTFKGLHWIEWVFWLMVIFTDLSKLYHGRLNLTVIPFLLFGRILPHYLNQTNYKQFALINIVGTLPFLLHPVYGLIRFSVYYNNSVGVLQTILTYFILTVLHDALVNRNKKESIVSLLYFAVNLLMIYLTGSRTAIMTAFFLLVYFGYHLLKERVKLLTIKKVLLMLGALALILYLSRGMIYDFYVATFLKWDRGIPGFDFTFTGRTDTWLYTLKNAQFLGGGQYFFRRFNNLTHGHNVLFNLLGFYGVIPFLAMTSIVLYMISIFLKTDQLNTRLFILLFVLVNAFEGSIGNYQHSYFEILFFIHLGYFISQMKGSKGLRIGREMKSER